MKLLGKLTLALAMLAPGWIMSANAASPTVTAKSSLKVLTVTARDKSDSGTFPGKKIASITDQAERTFLDGFLAHGDLYIQAEMGSIHMSTNCTGNKGGSGQCELTGTFTDTITVNSKNSLNGFLKLSGKVNGHADGGGNTHGGDISFKITVHNSGSAAHPKSIDTMMTYFDGWGDSKIDLAPLVEQKVAVEKSDRLSISAVQTLKAHAISMQNSYVFDVAYYHDTSHFYIDCLTSGFSLTADSGHNYSRPSNAVEDIWTLYE